MKRAGMMVLSCALAATTIQAALAQPAKYPDRPIRPIVPFPPGVILTRPVASCRAFAGSNVRRHVIRNPGSLLPPSTFSNPASLLLWRPRNAYSIVHIVIEVNERIEVPAAAQVVWKVLSDPYAVVECVPGAALGDKQEDGSYDATLTVKFGPAKVAFRARFTLELDPVGMSGQMASKARDNQGGTRVKTTMTFKVVEGETPGSSVIPIDAQVEISGRLASLVESGANLVVKRMTGEFTERLTARLAGAQTAVTSDK